MNDRPEPSGIPEKKMRLWLFNPFHYVAGVQALAAGVVIIFATGALAALSNSRLDGVLDFHTRGAGQGPLWPPVTDGLMAWLIMGILLLIGGKVISSSRIRALDIFGTQALARFPQLITAIFALQPGPRRYGQYLQVKYLTSGKPVEIYPLDALMFYLMMILSLLMLI